MKRQLARSGNATDEMKLNWNPEIEWPYLMSPESRALHQEYSQVLHRSLTTNHRLDQPAWARVLHDDALRGFHDDWRAYADRPAALQEFFRAVTE